MERYSNVLVDCTNLMYRSLYHNLREVVITKTNTYNGGVTSFLSRLDDLLFQFGFKDTTTMYCIFDNPNSEVNLRKLISDGEYKHARLNKKASQVVNQICDINIELLRHYNDKFKVVNGSKLEADDLTLPIIKKLKVDDLNRVLVISADFDWARNIDKNVDWFNYKKIYTMEIFKEEYEFYPNGNKIKMYKALKGDASDNIKNAVPYLKNEYVIDIVNNYKTPSELFSILWNKEKAPNFSKDIKIKLQEAERQIIKNFQLVDFADIGFPIDSLIKDCKRNVKLLNDYLGKLGLPLVDDPSLKKKKNPLARPADYVNNKYRMK